MEICGFKINLYIRLRPLDASMVFLGITHFTHSVTLCKAADSENLGAVSREMGSFAQLLVLLKGVWPPAGSRGRRSGINLKLG